MMPFLCDFGQFFHQKSAQNGAKLASSWGQNRAQEAIQEQLTEMLQISTTLERELRF